MSSDQATLRSPDCALPAPSTGEVVVASRLTASAGPVAGAPAPRTAAAADRLGIDLTSYLRWLPRRSGAWRYHALLFVLGRVMKLRGDSGVDILALRRRLARNDARYFRLPAWATRQAVDTAGVQSEWIAGDHTDPSRIVLYLHGGAFAFRFPNAHGQFAARLGRALRAAVLLPDYRLAPEHRYPAALDDCLAAYRWLLDRGTPPERIVVGGESAGGCLTLGLLLRLAREGLPQPAAAVALSPVTDAELSGETIRTRAAVDPVLPAEMLPLLRDLYLAVEHRRDEGASPLLGRYDGIAPVLIQVGTREVLLDDSLRVAQRIHETGGQVACEVWHDMPHAFPLVALLTESRLAIDHIAGFVATRAGWAPPVG